MTREKTPVTGFDVNGDGETRNILDIELDANRMDENADDAKLREYLVGVEWKDTLLVEDAYWETGMYANQNTVTKLQNQYTLEQIYDELEFGE